MEPKLIKYSSNQQASPYKQQQKITTPKKGSRVFNSRPSENLAPTSMHGYQMLNPMPRRSLSFSCPSPALFNHLIHYQYQNILKQQQGQPPLLPLPSITKSYSSFPSRNQQFSSSPTNKKMTKRVTKKSKPVKKEDAKPSNGKCDGLVNLSRPPLGPEPNELPTDAFKVLSSACPKGGAVSSIVAPPPSSLPLPRFSIKPRKLSCKGEAVGGDACASDDLRRILRIV